MPFDMLSFTNFLTGRTNVSKERLESIDRVWSTALTLAKAVAREHTQNGPFQDLIKQAASLQDAYTLDEQSEKESLHSWVEKQKVDSFLFERLGHGGKRLRFDTVTPRQSVNAQTLFRATRRPSALRTLMEEMSNQDFESFKNALLGETASFALKVRGDPEVGPLFRDLEIVLMPDGQRDEDSFKTFTVNLPLTELALEYYRRAYFGAAQALDGSLITRQVASLDSFPRKKAAMAAVKALQKATQELLNDADDSLLDLIRLQDMISLAGPVGDDPLDPFELFTDEERIRGEKAVKNKFLDKSLAEQRRPHSHWTGLMTHYDIHSVAQLLEAGTTVFTAQIMINGKSVQRDLHVYACPGPEEEDTSRATQSVYVSDYLATEIYNTHRRAIA